MKTCPSCGNEVRPVWPTCRTCGTLLIAPPSPVVPLDAPIDTGPSVEEQFFAPVAYRAPIQVDPPTLTYTHEPRAGNDHSGAGKWIALAAMLVFVVAAVATAAFTIKPSAAAKHRTPVVLAPRAPTAGLPTSLDVIVRVEAESARHTALQTIVETGDRDIGALAQAQPDYKWVAGDVPSADPHTVSVAVNGSVVTIAVAASNHDVCAFGQLSQNATQMYVTEGHVDTCAAADAPSSGWTDQPGGAASDLPDEPG